MPRRRRVGVGVTWTLKEQAELLSVFGTVGIRRADLVEAAPALGSVASVRLTALSVRTETRDPLESEIGNLATGLLLKRPDETTSRLDRWNSNPTPPGPMDWAKCDRRGVPHF